MIKKEAARGSAAAALLPSAATLSGCYRELGERIDQIVNQAQHEGSPRIALSGLSSLRQTLDSLARLATHEAAANSAQHTSGLDVQQVAERLIEKFDQQPELKARIAAALPQMDDADAPDTPAADNTARAASANSQTDPVDGPGSLGTAAVTTSDAPSPITPPSVADQRNTTNDGGPAADQANAASNAACARTGRPECQTNSAACATANARVVNSAPMASETKSAAAASNQISASDYAAQLAQFHRELTAAGDHAARQRGGA